MKRTRRRARINRLSASPRLESWPGQRYGVWCEQVNNISVQRLSACQNGHCGRGFRHHRYCILNRTMFKTRAYFGCDETPDDPRCRITIPGLQHRYSFTEHEFPDRITVATEQQNVEYLLSVMFIANRCFRSVDTTFRVLLLQFTYVDDNTAGDESHTAQRASVQTYKNVGHAGVGILLSRSTWVQTWRTPSAIEMGTREKAKERTAEVSVCLTLKFRRIFVNPL